MVELQDTRLDAVFHALGDPTRRLMIRRLAEGEQTVGQLAEPFSMSLAAASKHIRALEGAGLISRQVLGRLHICRLNAEPLSKASGWLSYYEKFWSARLDRLEELLRQDSDGHPAEPAAAQAAPRARKPRRGTLADGHTLRLQRRLPGPIERVWSCLAESDLRRQWLASGPMPLQAGASFELVWRNDELSTSPAERPE
eukprot:gene49346-66123_t